MGERGERGIGNVGPSLSSSLATFWRVALIIGNAEPSNGRNPQKAKHKSRTSAIQPAMPMEPRRRVPKPPTPPTLGSNYKLLSSFCSCYPAGGLFAHTRLQRGAARAHGAGRPKPPKADRAGAHQKGCLKKFSRKGY